MAKNKQIHDVVISYPPSEIGLAKEVADVCRKAGIEPWVADEFIGVNFSDALWKALAECRALVTILSPSGLTSWMGIEIGATRAWNKPIYVIATDLTSVRLPTALKGDRLFTVDGLDEIIRAIRLSTQQLTDEDRAALTTIYTDMGVPTDRLATDPWQLDGLVKRFKRSRDKNASGEDLLAELLRLRKQGKLPRKGPARRVKTGPKPA